MKEHEYFVYIVCSNSGTLYIGMTNSIYRRALQHKYGEIEGFAAKYSCNRLIYYESFDDVLRAIDREKQLKGWVRRKKVALIESKDPMPDCIIKNFNRHFDHQVTGRIPCVATAAFCFLGPSTALVIRFANAQLRSG